MEERAVLFVDDERDVLNSMKRLLRTEPYQSLFAQGGREAIDILKREKAHVIVTDLGMPEMDGMTLLQQVKEKYPEIIRLILSAHADSNSIFTAINKGNIYQYILKPWDNMELKLIVRQTIDLFNLQQERRELLKKLEEHNRLLEKRVEERTRQLLAIKSQAEIGKYASQIVHNLNSPLQVMCSGLELAEETLSSENPGLNDLRKYLEILKSGASFLKETISGILIHARDKSQYQTEQIDINKLVKGVSDFFMLNPVYKYQTEKRIHLSDNLPSIRANPIQIKQIIHNLIQNAIDAMEHSPEKRLTVETDMEDKAVAIRVSDTGEGIEEGNLTRIFSPDFTTKPIGKGTGLGLASVKTMVESYSGDIFAESRRGEGTKFVVKIPI